MEKEYHKIIEWLKKLNRNIVLKCLLSGSNKPYSKVLSATGLKITNELIELYNLSQGTNIKTGDILDDFHFFPGFYFMPLDESIMDYNTFKNDKRWDVNWFPIFANGGGDFYCVDCSNEDKSPIINFMLDYDTEKEHESIINMLKTIDECYKEGVYYVDERNYLEVDDYPEARKIRKRINGYI